MRLIPAAMACKLVSLKKEHCFCDGWEIIRLFIKISRVAWKKNMFSMQHNDKRLRFKLLKVVGSTVFAFYIDCFSNLANEYELM